MATRKKKKNFRLEPKEYHRILSNLKLHEIYLISFSASLDREKMLKYKNLKVVLNDKVTSDKQDDKLKVKHTYNLKIEPSENTKESPLKITATFELLFSSKFPIERDFFEIFKEINLPLNSWPYFREFAQSTTQRMNIPPLTLPFFRKS